MKLSRKNLSPTFQLNFFASLLPMTQPDRVCSRDFHCSGGITISGYIAKYVSTSTAMLLKKLLQSVVAASSPVAPSACPSFFAGSDPPNQAVFATRLTPGIDWSLPS